jgi:deoxyribodipyrimidine photo-lyase
MNAMDKPYKLSLHIFRRDLRLQDNTALINALNMSEAVIPCFIFDNRQVGANDYKSNSCLQFMATSLQELDQHLQTKGSRLFCFDGIAENIIAELLASHQIDAVFCNRDYTPFSRKRDANIAAACKKANVNFHVYADALLHEPEECIKANGEPYTIFTHFFKNASQLAVAEPVVNRSNHYYQQTLPESTHNTLDKLLKIYNPNLVVKGGRKEGQQLVKKIANIRNYKDDRNYPDKSAVTHLSAHHKFGTISIRETYAFIAGTLGRQHTLINELYWRDFFTHIAYHFPRVFGTSFHEKYDKLPWNSNEQLLRAWCDGMTGFPIVDAGMRELKTTGYMHNRVRMVTASFLTKDLLIDWRLGEKYFAQQLVDYDPAVNNGNWQWSASTGCDAQPYFRIFNPWLQQQKFDPDCLYIKRWIPELAHHTPQEIHQLLEKQPKRMSNYPQPIIDHRAASEKAKRIFKQIS